MADEDAALRRSKRARSSLQSPSVAAGANSRPNSCRTGLVATPSSGSACFNLSTKDLARAERMIERMMSAGIILNRGQPPKKNVAACLPA